MLRKYNLNKKIGFSKPSKIFFGQLSKFRELARTKLEYKGKLKFIENFVFIEPEDKK